MNALVSGTLLRIPAGERRRLASVLRAQLDAGVEPSAALEHYAAQSDSRAAAACRVMASAVRGGATLSEAASVHPELFGHSDVVLLRIGEETGSLVRVLGAMEQDSALQQSLLRKIAGALLYPIFLLNLAQLCFSVSVLMNSGVLPWLWGLVKLDLFLAVVTLACLAFHRHPVGRGVLDRAVLMKPGPGLLLAPPVLRHQRARLFSALGRCLEVGLGVHPSLEVALACLSNEGLRAELAPALDRVRDGSDLTRALAPCESLTPAQHSSIATGEQTGHLPAVLLGLARHERAALDRWLRLYYRLFPVALLLATVAAILVAVG